MHGKLMTAAFVAYDNCMATQLYQMLNVWQANDNCMVPQLLHMLNV